MPFNSGRVSFCRFHVAGDAPSSVDNTTLATLSEYAFRESSIGAPDEIESGWVTGEHIFDIQFSYEKNGFGTPGRELLLFAIRIDTNKVPGDIKRAYRRMNEQAMMEANPTGFLSKAEKREALETASRQVHDDLASGRFRKSRMVPLLWDFKQNTLYCGNSTSATAEQLAKLFHQCFNLRLTQMTSGMLLGHTLQESGRSRDYEDLLPTAFTAPPAEATIDHEEVGGVQDVSVPSVPWTTKSLDLKDFVGNEFLIWLWWLLETKEGMIQVGDKHELALLIDKSIDMDCAWDVRGKMSLRTAGPTRLPEAIEALKFGKWPRKAGLILAADDGEQFEFTLQADRLEIGSAQLPAATDAQTPREVLEHRLNSVMTLAEKLNALFDRFVQARCGGSWTTTRDAITAWIRGRGSQSATAAQAAAAAAAQAQTAAVVGEIKAETPKATADINDTNGDFRIDAKLDSDTNPGSDANLDGGAIEAEIANGAIVEMP